MSTRLPMAANDIGKIVAAGGQSGIAAKDLTAFAESAIKMGVAFDISAEQAGQSMAELRSAFRLTQPQVNVLADKINYLGNNTAASAKDIMEIVQRIGPLGEVAGSASGSIAAMGATLRGMGVANEIAATGIKNMLLTLTSGKAATKAQVAVFKQLGFTATQVSKSMQLNADETIRVILAKISRLPKHAQASALAELFGKESIGAIAPLLTNLDQLQGNLKMVGDATKYAGSMNKEYEAAAATTANQVKLFNGQVNALGVTIGSVLLPAVNGVLKTVSPWIGKVVSLAKEHPVVTQAIVGTAGALATLTVVTYGAGFAWTFLKGGLLNTVGLFARVAAGATLAGAANTTAAAGTTLLGTAFRFVGKSILWAGRALLLNPIGLAVTAIAGGAYLIYKNWEPLKKWFTDLWADITATFDAAIGKIVGLINSVGEKWNTFKTTVSEGVGDAWKGTKQFFGIDDDSSKPAASPGAPVLVAPAAPQMANRAGGTQITTNDSYQISVQATPGMDEDALARKVAQQLRQQQSVRQRSMMTDGVLTP
ncbi:phage tail tape measure protein [Enterobacter sp. IF2SW-B1]|nr:phage tail tape measure protein [Enterobacter sp. IF2SW-B1]